jgi:hypothetical protein
MKRLTKGLLAAVYLMVAGCAVETMDAEDQEPALEENQSELKIGADGSGLEPLSCGNPQCDLNCLINYSGDRYKKCMERCACIARCECIDILY